MSAKIEIQNLKSSSNEETSSSQQEEKITSLNRLSFVKPKQKTSHKEQLLLKEKKLSHINKTKNKRLIQGHLCLLIRTIKYIEDHVTRILDNSNFKMISQRKDKDHHIWEKFDETNFKLSEKESYQLNSLAWKDVPTMVMKAWGIDKFHQSHFPFTTDGYSNYDNNIFSKPICDENGNPYLYQKGPKKGKPLQYPFSFSTALNGYNDSTTGRFNTYPLQLGLISHYKHLKEKGDEVTIKYLEKLYNKEGDVIMWHWSSRREYHSFLSSIKKYFSEFSYKGKKWNMQLKYKVETSKVEFEMTLYSQDNSNSISKKASSQKKKVKSELTKEQEVALVTQIETINKENSWAAKVKAPSKKAKVKAPSKKAKVKAPEKKKEVKAPDKKEEVKDPSKKAQVKAPSKKAKVKAPAKKVEVKAPVKKEEVKAPVKKEEVKAPENDLIKLSQKGWKKVPKKKKNKSGSKSEVKKDELTQEQIADLLSF